jgi:hypothetical protein
MYSLRTATTFKHIIPYKELQLKDAVVIGRGAFGVVYSAVWRGRTVAGTIHTLALSE